MKRFLCVLAIVLVLFFAVCCDTDGVSKTLSGTGKNIFHNTPSAEEKAEILAKEAKDEIETLFTGEGLEEGEESLENSIEYLIEYIFKKDEQDTKKLFQDSTQTQKYNYIKMAETFNALATKYGDTEKAWSAIRSYLKYKTVFNYPNILNNPNYPGYSTDNTQSLAKAITQLKKDTYSREFKLISILYRLVEDDETIDALEALTDKKITIASPSLDKTSIKFSAENKTVKITGYNSEFMTLKCGAGVTQETTITENKETVLQFSAQGESGKNKSYSVSFTLKDPDTYKWKSTDDKTVTLKWSVNDVSSSKKSVTITVKCKDSSGTLSNFKNEYSFDGKTSYLYDITCTNKDDGNVPYNVTVTKDGEVVDEIYNPGYYTIKVTPADTDTYSGSKTVSFTITDPFDDATEVIKDDAMKSLLGIAFSLEGEVLDFDELLNSKQIPYQNKLGYYSTQEEDFYDFIVDMYSDYSVTVADTDPVYLYLDFLPAIYLNAVMDCLEEALSTLLNSSQNRLSDVQSGVYGDCFTVSEVDCSTFTLEELSNAADFANKFKTDIKALKTSSAPSKYKKLENFTAFSSWSEEKQVAVIKLFNLIQILDDPTQIISSQEMIDKVDFLICSLKNCLKYVERLYQFDDLGKPKYILPSAIAAARAYFIKPPLEYEFDELDGITVEAFDVGKLIDGIMAKVQDALALEDKVK